jgi:hypothetical protein
MKNLFALLFIGLSVLSLSSQTTADYPIIERSTDWILYQEANGVQQYYMFAECNIPEEGFFREYVLIKIVNTTSETKQVDWDIVKWYGKNCNNCDEQSQEQHRSVIVEPNASLIGNCSLKTDKTLKMFSKFLNYQMEDWVLTHFELRNYIVK